MNSRSTRKPTGDSSNKKTSKKRKSMDDSDNLNEVMKQFSEKTDARLGEITKCLINAFDITEATNNVFQVLDYFEWLTMEAKVFAAKNLVNNSQELKFFFKLPDYAKNVPRFHGENFEVNKLVCERICVMSTEKGCTPSQLALAWVQHQGTDVCPIPGTTKIGNFNENLRSLSVTLTQQEMYELNSLADVVKGDRSPFMGNTFFNSETPPLSSWKDE